MQFLICHAGRKRNLFSRRAHARALLDSLFASRGKTEGSGAPKGASNHCPRTADKSTQSAQTNLRAEARQNRGVLAFRRSTAALASAVATASGSAPEPRFLGRGWGGCFARLGPVQSSELLADRSFCRPSGAPEPPGCGVHNPPAGTAPAPPFRHAFRKGALDERDSLYVTEAGTDVKMASRRRRHEGC